MKLKAGLLTCPWMVYQNSRKSETGMHSVVNYCTVISPITMLLFVGQALLFKSQIIPIGEV